MDARAVDLRRDGPVADGLEAEILSGNRMRDHGVAAADEDPKLLTVEFLERRAGQTEPAVASRRGGSQRQRGLGREQFDGGSGGRFIRHVEHAARQISHQARHGSHSQNILLGRRVGPQFHDRHGGIDLAMNAELESHPAAASDALGNADHNPRGLGLGQRVWPVQLDAVGPQALHPVVHVVAGIRQRQDVGQLGMETGVLEIDRLVAEDGRARFLVGVGVAGVERPAVAVLHQHVRLALGNAAIVVRVQPEPFGNGPEDVGPSELIRSSDRPGAWGRQPQSEKTDGNRGPQQA